MRPPEKIYREPQKSFLIVMYKGWVKKPDLYTIPYVWHNFIPPGDVEVNTSYIGGTTRALFEEYVRDTEGEEFGEVVEDCYMYVIQFHEPEEYSEAQANLEALETSKGVIQLPKEEIENLYKYLLTYPQYEIIIKPAKNGEEPEQTQAGEL